MTSGTPRFLGVHVGRGSFRAILLRQDGAVETNLEGRFREPGDLPRALLDGLGQLSRHPAWPTLTGASVGLDKGLRCALPVAELRSFLPETVPLLTMPAHQAILLGAVPHGPALLVSLGAELRLAALDSTHTYREFRLQEGGGVWWTAELSRLAQHSQRLSRALAPLSSRQKIMKALPRLLEGADFPSPDPVLKARTDGLCATIAESCLGLSSRLPGVRGVSFSGFLHPSPMSRRIAEACSPPLRLHEARFPAEVGAALLGLALFKENQERRHLGKPLESGESPADRWSVPPVLIRRLFRLRKPFEHFVPSGAVR